MLRPIGASGLKFLLNVSGVPLVDTDMNEQLFAEHAEHVAGCQSEPQMCLDEAHQRLSRLRYGQAREIAAALAAGKFCVVEDIEYHCRATDALAGTYSALRSVHDTRKQAGEAARRSYDDPRNALERFIYVLPREPVFLVEPQVAEPACDCTVHGEECEPGCACACHDDEDVPF